jgi:plasmid stabilization system protein ParE
LTTPAYVLTDAAETDLRAIIRYTRKRWGDDQVRRYLRELETCITRLAKAEGVYSDTSEIHPDLRMSHCEHHYVFCLPRVDGPALIVAILHERMDLMARIADRLKPV